MAMKNSLWCFTALSQTQAMSNGLLGVSQCQKSKQHATTTTDTTNHRLSIIHSVVERVYRGNKQSLARCNWPKTSLQIHAETTHHNTQCSRQTTAGVWCLFPWRHQCAHNEGGSLQFNTFIYPGEIPLRSLISFSRETLCFSLSLSLSVYVS